MGRGSFLFLGQCSLQGHPLGITRFGAVEGGKGLAQSRLCLGRVSLSAGQLPVPLAVAGQGRASVRGFWPEPCWGRRGSWPVPPAPSVRPPLPPVPQSPPGSGECLRHTSVLSVEWPMSEGHLLHEAHLPPAPGCFHATPVSGRQDLEKGRGRGRRPGKLQAWQREGPGRGWPCGRPGPRERCHPGPHMPISSLLARCERRGVGTRVQERPRQQPRVSVEPKLFTVAWLHLMAVWGWVEESHGARLLS